MNVNGFLAGLPALLGIVGFIVYQILQHFGKPNAIVTAIVGKLRVAAPERVPDQRLTAGSVDRLLRRDDGPADERATERSQMDGRVDVAVVASFVEPEIVGSMPLTFRRSRKTRIQATF
jgi:hypothetical protein